MMANAMVPLQASVGDRAPDFTLPDHLGCPVSLRERRACGPVVLAFYRGAWCPFCNLERRALQEALPDIKGTRMEPAAIIAALEALR